MNLQRLLRKFHSASTSDKIYYVNSRYWNEWEEMPGSMQDFMVPRMH